jgi:hypothetical protein
MGQVVTDGICEVRDQLACVERQIAERLLLKPDSDRHDPLCRSLQHAYAGLLALLDEPLKLRWPGVGPVSVLEEVDLDQLIAEFEDECFPGIVTRQLNIEIAAPAPEQRRVLSVVAAEVREILREILLGAVDSPPREFPHAEKRLAIDVRRDAEGFEWQVAVHDQCPAMRPELVAAINERKHLPPPAESAGNDRVEERAWGLALAQRLAQENGARICVQRGIDGHGNIITLHLPILSDDGHSDH